MDTPSQQHQTAPLGTGTGTGTGIGIGMAWSPAVAALLDSSAARLDLLEIDPRGQWHAVRGGAGFEPPAARTEACVMHAAGLPLANAGELPAGVDASDSAAQLLRETAARLQPAWVSAPLAFTRAGLLPDGSAARAGVLLPPLPCAATVLVATRRIEQLRRLCGRPVAFQIVANPLRPVAGEMADGDFYAALAEAASCGIVVDLQALRVNERAGRATVREVLARLPRERVWALRSGHAAHPGAAPEARGSLLPLADFALMAEWLPALPQLAAVIVDSAPERWRAQGLDAAAIGSQLDSLRALWAARTQRGTARSQSAQRSVFARPLQTGPVESPGPHGPVCSVTAWERALVALVHGRDLPRGSLALAPLQADPGLETLRCQAQVARSRLLLKALPLSWRALVLKAGQPAAEELRLAFWQHHLPGASAAAEGAAFAAFVHRALDDGRLSVPHLRSLLDYELMGTGAAPCDGDPAATSSARAPGVPTRLLTALARGEWPAALPS